MKLAIATFSGMPAEFRDDEILLELLRGRNLDVTYRTWDDPDVDWNSFSLVVARTPWDYSTRHEEFLAWTQGLRTRLENPVAVIAWNADKRYLGDLGEDGVPVVPTTYVGPGEAAPEITGDVVVKPSVSAGARDTGRFSTASAAAGAELIARITGRGDTAMVQPFIEGVETSGETAVVMIDGALSHVLHKRPVLRADEVAPVRADALGVAEAMYDPELVGPGSVEPDQLELAEAVIAAVERRFGAIPLIARVDMLRDADGRPLLLELEAIEPNLYFEHAPGAAERLAAAIERRFSAAS